MSKEKESAPKHRQERPARRLRRPGRTTSILTAAAIGVSGATAAYIHDRSVQNDRIARLAQELESTQMQNQRADARVHEQAATIERLGAIVAALGEAPREMGVGEKLTKIENLPGYGQEVDPRLAASLRAATVQIVTRPKGNTQASWSYNCTGLKIDLGDEQFVTTGKHCLGITPPEHTQETQLVEAYNASPLIVNDYGVQSVSDDGIHGDVIPVSAMSVTTRGDVALLRMDASPSSKVSFDKIPAMPDYTDGLKKQLPLPGAETVVFSLPSSGGGNIVTDTGIYLGTLSDPHNPNLSMTYVGLKGLNASSDDTCYFGASGSTALTATGMLTGTLWWRSNTNYGSGDGIDPEQSDAIKYRLDLESELGMDLSTVDTICAFNAAEVVDGNTLIAGFDTPYQNTYADTRVFIGGGKG